MCGIHIHIPVLAGEIIQYIRPSPGDIIVDATMGTGGHSKRIMEYVQGQVTVIGIDKDEQALSVAKERLKGFKRNIRFFHADFKDFDAVMKAAEIKRIQGCVFDLGISSYQMDDPERGFSYSEDGPLDMRMDRSTGLRAEQVVNGYSRQELIRIFKEYADERNPGKVADAVIREREKETIGTTRKLAQIFKNASSTRKGTHCPEAPLFQAIRIEVNGELEAVTSGIEQSLSFLEPGARICAVSFHSGEDRIIKRIFKKYETEQTLSVLTSSPVTPSLRELRENPRSRSAKMRAAERN